MSLLKFKHFIKYIGLTQVLLILCISANSQDITPERVVENINTFNKEYPQQKLYLHLDKNYYYPGENMWFKAYLVDAKTHLRDTLSHNLYVELFDSNGDDAAVRLLKLDNGLAKGDIQLPDSLPEGNYTLRAYTTWMLNFGEDYVFEKPLYIENQEEENYISLRDIWRNRRFNRKFERKQDDYQFYFYPEGGDLIENTESRVAFKAKNEIGEGIEVEGQLKTQDGNVIADLESKHSGMGYFEFVPSENKSYYAEIRFPDGSQDEFDLPDIYSSGYSMRVDNPEDGQKININIEAEGEVRSDLAIIGMTRGEVNYFDEFSLNNNQAELTIAKEKFETGISKITLFDDYATPLAERLVFIDNQDYLNIDIDESFIEDRDADRITINIEDADGNLVEGTFSLGITKIPEKVDHRGGILANLLLSSDLKGYIKNPCFYFCDDNEEAFEALDILMMTHGWRRFDVEKVAAGDYPDIEYGIMTGLNIEGKVTTPSARRGVDFAKVEMMIHGEADKDYTTEANKNGEFVFSDIIQEGLFEAEFTASHPDYGANLRIELESAELTDKDYSFNIYTQKREVTWFGSDWERVSTITHRDKYKKDARFDRSDAGSHYLDNPDQVIYFEEISTPHSTLGEVLRGRVTGLRFDDGEMTIRGHSSIEGSSRPAFFVDGVQINQSRFLQKNPEDIERVEIFKGTSAALLGVRGAGGALMAYSKRGGVENIRSYVYQFMGYHSPREFYVQSDEEIDRERNSEYYKTLIWEPNVKVNEEGEITIDFPRELEEGKYEIRLEGIDFEGKPGSVRKILKTPEKQDN